MGAVPGRLPRGATDYPLFSSLKTFWTLLNSLSEEDASCGQVPVRVARGLGDGVEAWALGRLGGVDPDSPLRVLTERGFRAGGGKGSRQRWVPSPRWPLPGRLCCSGKRRDGGLGAADPVEAGVQGAPGAQHPLVDWAQGPPASDGVGGVGCGAVARRPWAPLAAEAPAVGRAWVPGREHPGKPPWVSGCPARPALRTAVPLVVLVLSSGGWVLLEPQGGGHF